VVLYRARAYVMTYRTPRAGKYVAQPRKGKASTGMCRAC